MAITVGAAVTAAAAFSAAGACAGPADPSVAGSADEVCVQLVRTLAERTGLAVAAMTAIVVLTAVGLFRLVEGGGGPDASPR